MWPRSELTELLGIAHPIIQAPMSGFATPALVAAVFDGVGDEILQALGESGEVGRDRWHAWL